MDKKVVASEIALGAAISDALIRLSDAQVAAIVAVALETRTPEIRREILRCAHRLGIPTDKKFAEELIIALREGAAAEAERTAHSEAIRAGHRKRREGRAAAGKALEATQIASPKPLDEVPGVVKSHEVSTPPSPSGSPEPVAPTVASVGLRPAPTDAAPTPASPGSAPRIVIPRFADRGVLGGSSRPTEQKVPQHSEDVDD